MRRRTAEPVRSLKVGAVGVIGVLLTLFASLPAAAQCCVVGVPSLPAGSSEVLPLSRGYWKVSTVMRVGRSTDVLEGTREVAVPLDHRRETLAAIARIEYGWSDRIAIQAVVPYVLERTTTAGFTSDRSQLGDVGLMVQYGLITGPPSSWRVRLGSGMSLPIGDPFESGLGSDPNQSTGTRDLLLSAGVLRFTGARTGVDASISYRVVTSTGTDGRHLGNVLQASAGWVWGIRGSRLPIRLGLAALHRQKDVLDGVVNRNSGGLWAYATPGIAWKVTGPSSAGLDLTLSGEIPLYREVNGQQLTEDFAFILGLAYQFGGR